MLVAMVAQRWIKRWPVWVRFVLAISGMVGMFSAFALVDPSMFRGLLGQPTALFIPLCFFTVPVGVSFLVHGLKGKRKGESLHCPKCDYELGVEESEAPRRCPECGEPWLGRWVKGAKVRSKPMIWIGCVLLLIFAMLLSAGFTPLGSAVLGMLPTRTVLSIAAMDAWGHNSRAWAELNKRTLTAQDEAAFATSLLDRRLAAGYLYGAPAAWLENAIDNGGAAGPLPATLHERYYAEWFEPKIDIPDEVEQGELRAIAFSGKTRSGGATSWMYVWVEEVREDDTVLDPTPWRAGQMGGWHYSLNYDPTISRMSPREPEPEPKPMDTTRLGPHRIRMKLNEYVMARGKTPPVPPGPGMPGCLDFRTVELDKTVNVRPRKP
jgi:hypothetical protein